MKEDFGIVLILFFLNSAIYMMSIVFDAWINKNLYKVW